MAIFQNVSISVILWYVTWLCFIKTSSLLLKWDGNYSTDWGSFGEYSDLYIDLFPSAIVSGKTVREGKRSKNCLRIIDAKLFLLTEFGNFPPEFLWGWSKQNCFRKLRAYKRFLPKRHLIGIIYIAGVLWKDRGTIKTNALLSRRKSPHIYQLCNR